MFIIRLYEYTRSIVPLPADKIYVLFTVESKFKNKIYNSHKVEVGFP